jgi:cellulose synthase operon protein C
MAGSFSGRIAWTEDAQVFQSQCRALLVAELGDPNVEVYGRNGQAQKGIDLRGVRNNVAADHWVGGQCRLLVGAEKLDLKKVEKAAREALGIIPPLREFIVLTNAPNDVAAQDFAAAFTQEQVDGGRLFRVAIWAAQEIEDRSKKYPNVFDQFFPDALPHVSQIVEGQERIRAESALQGSNILDRIQAVGTEISSLTTAIGNESESAIGLQTALDREITSYRELANNGSPRRALDYLLKLFNELPPTADNHIRFRAVANIGACYLRMGKNVEAAERYLQAYAFAPESIRAISLKALAYVLLDQPQQAWDWCLAQIDAQSRTGPPVLHVWGSKEIGLGRRRAEGAG